MMSLSDTSSSGVHSGTQSKRAVPLDADAERPAEHGELIGSPR